MPKSTIDYSKCLIYKLVCNDLDVKECYVGSTTNFTQRKKNHKSVCNNQIDKEYNSLKYKIIRENGGWNNWSMIEIEKYPCNDNREAVARERYWWELLHAEMNTLCPFITENERINRGIEQSKNWYENNKEKAKEQRKNWYNINKEKAKELSKNYYENNKEKLNEKCVCDCGGRYTAIHKSTHLKSKKHQLHIQSFSEQI